MNLGGVILNNPTALWALAALPALVAVHFFQQRARRVVTSTRFLIEALTPESQGGRTWERFRASRSFWAQVLAVLLATWVLAEPRWPRTDSTQTVVLVLDDAIAMQAVADEARAGARRLMAELAGRAATTEWVVTGSDPRAPARYRGGDRARAEAAVAAWRPTLGTHDHGSALRAGRGLAGAGGVCWFVTDRESKVPADQPALGVGRPLANVGFAGGEVRAAGAGGAEWRAVVKNHSGETQRRGWWFEGAGGASERRTVELAPEGVVELSGVWPASAERAVLRLEGDDFAADDALPLVRPRTKRLGARVAVGGERGEFFRRLLANVEGVETAAVPAGVAAAEVAKFLVAEHGAEASGPAVLLAPAAPAAAAGTWTGAGSGSEGKLLRAPVVAERHSLVADLNWQGLLGRGAAGLRLEEGDEALLWQNEAPLAWLRPGAEGRRGLVLNLDWEASNAGRLPAMVLMLRRFVEDARDAQAGVYSANFDAGGAVPLAAADLARAGGWTVAIEGGETRAASALELAVLRAPGEAGFFEVRRGEDTLVRGAAQFADARQGDFRDAGTFRRDPPAGEATAARERNLQGDPLAAWWLALAVAALVASWWPGRAGAARTESWPQKGAEGAKRVGAEAGA